MLAARLPPDKGGDSYLLAFMWQAGWHTLCLVSKEQGRAAALSAEPISRVSCMLGHGSARCPAG